MSARKITAHKGQQEALPEETQEIRDHFGQLIYERACELIRSPEMLIYALSLDSDEHIKVSGASSPKLTSQQLAELIIADDAETLGRLVINQVINVCWTMAEEDLGLKASENPEEPPYTIDGITH